MNPNEAKRAIEENTAEVRKLNHNLEQFREEIKVVMAYVQGMGGAQALVQQLSPLQQLLPKLGGFFGQKK
jgi:hypothetical protein